MPIRTVRLIGSQSSFIDQLVESDRFRNADEVIFEAIKLMEMAQTDPKANHAILLAAIQQGIDSIEAGNFTAFDSSEALGAHLNAIADEAIAEAESELAAEAEVKAKVTAHA